MDEELLKKYGITSSQRVPQDEKREAPTSGDDLLAKYGIGQKPKDVTAAAAPDQIPSLLDFIKDYSGSQAKRQSYLEAHKSDKKVATDTGVPIMDASRFGSGMTVEALKELYNRATSMGQKGSGDWQAALDNKAQGIPEQLQGAGVPKPLSYMIGLPAGIATDPFADVTRMYTGSFPGADEYLPAVAKNAMNVGKAIRGAPSNTWDAMKAAAGKLEEAGGLVRSQPIGDTIKGTGKWLYRQAFRKADSKLATKYKDSNKFGPNEYSDLMWNEGKPLTSGSMKKGTAEMANDVSEMTKQAGKDIGNTIKQAGTGEFHLAPDLESNATEGSLYDAIAKDQPLKDDHDGIEWLKQMIASDNKEDVAKGLEVLSKSAPDFSGVINKQANHLRNSNDRGSSISFLHGLIDDIREPRDLEGWQSLKQSMANAADGSVPMQTSSYVKGGKTNISKNAEMQGAGVVADVIDKKIEDAIPNTFPQQKRKYSILRRGEDPTTKYFETELNRPAFSKFDAALASGGLVGSSESDNPIMKNVSRALLAYGSRNLVMNPRMATMIGTSLGKLGNTSLWDQLLRAGAIQNEAGNAGSTGKKRK